MDLVMGLIISPVTSPILDPMTPVITTFNMSELIAILSFLTQMTKESPSRISVGLSAQTKKDRKSSFVNSEIV